MKRTMKKVMDTMMEAMGTMKEASIVDLNDSNIPLLSCEDDYNNNNNNNNSSNNQLPSCVDDQLLDFDHLPSCVDDQLLDFDLPPDYSPSRKPNQPRKPNHPLPDYSLSHKPHQPPPYTQRAMCSLRSCSTVGLYNVLLVSLILLGTIINITVSCSMTNNEIALKQQLIVPFVQNLLNFLFWKEFRYGNVRKHRNLWNENDDLENGNRMYGNRMYGNQKNNKFWPIWKYSAPVLVIMVIAFIRQVPIAMVMAMGAHISINIAFLFTFIVRFRKGDTSQDFNAGLLNGGLAMMAVLVLLLAGGFLGAN